MHVQLLLCVRVVPVNLTVHQSANRLQPHENKAHTQPPRSLSTRYDHILSNNYDQPSERFQAAQLTEDHGIIAATVPPSKLRWGLSKRSRHNAAPRQSHTAGT